MADDDESDVYRVETVPPPPGESDAYNAPTKVGATAHAVLDAMKRAAESGAPLKPMELPTARKAATPEVVAVPTSDRAAIASSPPPQTPAQRDVSVVVAATPSKRVNHPPHPENRGGEFRRFFTTFATVTLLWAIVYVIYEFVLRRR